MRSKQTQRPQAKICQNISDSDLDSRHDSTAGGLSPTGPIRSGLRSRTHILVRCVFTRMLQKQPLPFLSIRYLRCRCSGYFHFPSNARQLLQLLRFATRACFGFWLARRPLGNLGQLASIRARTTGDRLSAPDDGARAPCSLRNFTFAFWHLELRPDFRCSQFRSVLDINQN